MVEGEERGGGGDPGEGRTDGPTYPICHIRVKFILVALSCAVWH